jgi:putative heme iron utilization protein
MNPRRPARDLVARERHGVLCTAHAAFDGWPFGSIVPYALTPEGDPVVLLATIAEHSKNLLGDPRTSLFVADPASADDPQAGARVTLLCRAEIPQDALLLVARAAWAERYPDREVEAGAHDFVLHVLRVERVRWIAGFGEMGWLDRACWGSER